MGYLPKSQYKKVSTNETGPLEDANGNPYTGTTVIKTSTGRFFKVAAKNLALGIFAGALELFISELLSPNQKPALRFTPSIEDVPSDVDFTTRYFHKNKITNEIKEISENQYNETLNNGKLYEEVVTLQWKVTEPVENVLIGKYEYKGSKHYNEQAVKELESTFGGIETYMKDKYNSLTRATPVVLAGQHIPEDKGIVIPSPGKKL